MVLDLGFLLVLAMVSAGLGLSDLATIRRGVEHPGDALALALPLGLGVLSLGVLGLGELGWMSAGAIAGLLGVAGALGLPETIRSLRGGVPATGPVRPPGTPPTRPSLPSGEVSVCSLAPRVRAGIPGVPPR